ncbi:MAG: thioredoxin family protein [Candidatus Aenigmarchaeota archaeon]|nr:thioredoxin family protein [Candidatus Aenigmarchaeota archaeon]
MLLKKWRLEIIVFSFIAAALVLLVSFVPINYQTKLEKSSLPDLGKSAELTGIKGWINTEPFNLSDLKGKIVLIDFWTYSCINCIRTLPYLKDWYDKYHDKGLVIVGVHTPEFEFEKDYGNVKMAVERYGVKYPVVLDNDYGTWLAFKNNYWPREYLIDANGIIRHDHIGEGGYDETEKAIQELLRENDANFHANMTNITSETDFSQIGTPELYVGYGRGRLGNEQGYSSEIVVEYKTPKIDNINTIYLSGKWLNQEDSLVASGNSKVFLMYKAKDVNIVAGGKSTIHILLDNSTIAKEFYGKDGNETVNIDEQRLYNIVSAPDYSVHLLEIDASDGFKLYTFTFG